MENDEKLILGLPREIYISFVLAVLIGSVIFIDIQVGQILILISYPIIGYWMVREQHKQWDREEQEEFDNIVNDPLNEVLMVDREGKKILFLSDGKLTVYLEGKTFTFADDLLDLGIIRSAFKGKK